MNRGSATESTGVTDQIVGRSALGKIWKFPSDRQPSSELVQAAGGSVMLARLLLSRGMESAAQAKAFLTVEDYVPTPASELPDVDKAVARIIQAIASNEQVTVYGDYDVDGVTGTAVLYTVLRRLGASVDFYIPNRAGEGYGLNLKAVSILASKHRTKLIITCDCGVSNFAEINFARSLGVDTLVLDHHTMPEVLPPAVAVVHPKRLEDTHPLFHLPGVGVAYKVCEALLTEQEYEDEVKDLLDFLTLGLIADMVPLIRENRYLVKIGLPALAKSPRPGIQALLAQCGKMEDTDIVGFGLAPRINAVGRLSDARAAVELMTTDDPEVAENLARQLQTENARRQELCERIFEEADRLVSTRVDLNRDRAIAIYDKDWHHGVVGIVASRLVEKYNRPVFIGELDPAEGTVKGSARSIDAIDLYQVLKANEHLLTKFGGHKMAAGFAMEAEKAEAACRALVETCNRMLDTGTGAPVLELDATVVPSEVTMDLATLITQLAPFGMSNKKPLFCLSHTVCSAIRPLGKEGKHARVMVLDSEQSQAFECVMWNSRGRLPQESNAIDIVFTPEINSYNGRDRLQLVLVDWRLSASQKNANESVSKQPPVPPPVVIKPRPLADVVEQLKPVTRDKAVESDIQRLAQRANHKPELLDVSLPVGERLNASSGSFKHVWKDLRGKDDPLDLARRAANKLGNRVAIFGESCTLLDDVRLTDRTGIDMQEHLLFWQMPPSAKVFQEILMRSPNSQLYLLGAGQTEFDEPSSFLKRAFGVVRYAINKRDGQVQGDKLAATMGASKMSVALALTILRKVNLVDWFTEDGCIYLDLIGSPDRDAEELPEYKQLAQSLSATAEFRDWCTTARLEDIQLSVMPNQVSAAPDQSYGSEVEMSTSDEE